MNYGRPPEPGCVKTEDRESEQQDRFNSGPDSGIFVRLSRPFDSNVAALTRRSDFSHSLFGGALFAQPAQAWVTSTGARPLKPSACAAAGVSSIMRPRTNGPRSLIRTVTLRPFRLLVTLTFVPNGSVRCAAVRPLGCALSP